MDVAWEFPAISSYTTTAESRGKSGNCSAAKAKVVNAQQFRQTFAFQHRAAYRDRVQPPIHSGFVGRAPATLRKRIPINMVGD